MGIIQEFRKFALKGNVVDLAVGVIIGAAFGKIVDSVVNDLIMPIVAMAGNSDFSNYYLGLKPATFKAEFQGLSLAKAKELGPVFAWGNFLTVTVNFLILAFIIFLMVKGINKLKHKEEEALVPVTPPAPPEPSNEEKLLMEIRDLLKKQV